MNVGVVKETFPGERRVALVPDVIPSLTKASLEVVVESGAGVQAGFDDSHYESKGATIDECREEVLKRSNIICQVRTLGANREQGRRDLPMMSDGQVVIGLAEPLDHIEPAETMAAKNIRCFALELLPRITRAQSMDVLSSQATVSGYKAVLIAAELLPRMFPMMMTAAGTVTPAKVFVVGVGVAGLQAIASARRIGGVVTAYDIRPTVNEQVQSLGGRFLELELETEKEEATGGYAKQMDDSFYERQREMMAKAVAESDVVITTAAVPGKNPPMLITAEMVRSMRAGSVVIDLAARPEKQGGNCELTQPDETVVENGVTILGPTNLPSSVPHTASQMYAKNMSNFVLHIVKDGTLNLDTEDEIIRDTFLTDNGKIVNKRIPQGQAT